MTASSDDDLIILEHPPAPKASSSSAVGIPEAKKAKTEAIVITDSEDEGQNDVAAMIAGGGGNFGRTEVAGKSLRSQPRPSYGQQRKYKNPRPTPTVKVPPRPSSSTPKPVVPPTTTTLARDATTAANEALDSKRRAFLRKHRPIFLALLPEHNNKAFLHLVDKPSGSNSKEIVSVEPFQMLPQPKGIKGEMHAYQLHGFSFLAHLLSNGINTILADEMGLGKTLQTIALLVHVNANSQAGKADTHARKPHLIICPLSVLSAWMNEVARWSSLKAIRFHGERKERERLKLVLREEMADIDIVLTTCTSRPAVNPS